MAIDDVMSDYDNAVSSGSALAVQPASGDEWLVTQFFLCGAIATWDLQSHTNSEHTCAGLWGGNVAGNAFEIGIEVGLHPVRYLVSNSEYIRLSNRTGSTQNTGFSAVKMKE
jgi:hypothetical protein